MGQMPETWNSKRQEDRLDFRAPGGLIPIPADPRAPTDIYILQVVEDELC